MNYQTRAIQISLLLHGVIIALAVMSSTFMGQYKKVMVLNFDLQKTAPAVKKIEDLPAPVMKTKTIKPVARQSIKEKEPSRMTEDVSPIAHLPETPPVVKLPEAHNLESHSMGPGLPDSGTAVKEGSPGIAGTTGGPSNASSSRGNADGCKEAAGAKYLNENFAYIRDKILGNVSYPHAAKKMSWQGKVVLSFIITAKGTVGELKVIKSSGFPILDKNAMETVRNTAPFPKPPVEAQLVIPIVYRLE